MFEVKQLKGKHNRLKEIWKNYYDLMVADSGIGWNPESNLPKAEPIIWEQLAKSNAAAAKLRYKGFPHYLKLDVVFAGRAATRANARASIHRATTLCPEPSSNNENDSMDLGTPPATTPSTNNIRTTLSRGKRKAYENNVMKKLVATIDGENKAIVEKLEKNESWSIEKGINLLNSFDDIDRRTFNFALRHF